jgi:SAM-dependent methyltransferase
MSELIKRDVYLYALYQRAFSSIKSQLPKESPVIVEIGAGNGISSEFIPNVILTDISYDDSLNAVCDSVALPFKSGSIDAIILHNAFHHIPQIESFLLDAHRVLRIGGRIVIFEPYWGRLAKFVYQYLHQEKFDSKTKSWSFHSTSPWDSNQALSFLLLRRDRIQFDRKFSFFDIAEHEVLIGPSFLLSGGVSRRTAISGRFLRNLLNWEAKRSSWFNSLRFFHVFSLTRNL